PAMTRPVLLLLAALLVLAWPAPAPAQAPPPAGQLEVGLVSADPDFLFWIGRTAMQAAAGAKTLEARERYLRIAVRAFERLLVIDPSEVRPRLELARALFLLEEDRRARRQFEKALAGKLPAMVERNIRFHLDTLRRRKRWFATLGVALAPDSNIGAADDGDTLHVGPFRFRLDDPRKPESGIGLRTWGNVQYFHPLRPGLNWRAGADLSLREYPNREFDGLYAGVRTGPQILLGPLNVSLLAEAGHNRRAGQAESHEVGVRLESSLRLGPRLTLHPHARRVERTYRDVDEQDGPRWSAGLRAGFRATPQLTLHGGATHAGERPERRDYRNVRRSVDLGASYDAPFGITVGLDASIAWTRFEPDWGFLTQGEPKRKDRLRSYRLTLQHRGWKVGGFAPRLSVAREERRSNAQLQDYERWHGEIALVRRF
ncbi:MAG: DUF560 domain-containing protein, partial [Alphaproteobacteria bacterium]|nr:DUF560 domain-containing protein [Alphaproteobacteria bacterium]